MIFESVDLHFLVVDVRDLRLICEGKSIIITSLFLKSFLRFFRQNIILHHKLTPTQQPLKTRKYYTIFLVFLKH